MDLLDRLLRFLEREWTTVSAAPASFLIGCGAFAFIAYRAAAWRFGGVIATLTEKVDLWRDRVAVKDAQLDEYREKVGGMATNEGQVAAQLSSADLQARTLAFVKELRDWRQAHERASRSQSLVSWRSTGQTEEERERLWTLTTEQMMQESMRFMHEYESNFKGRALALRDELQARGAPKGERANHFYEHPTNPLGVGMLTDDLERMARALPASS